MPDRAPPAAGPCPHCLSAVGAFPTKQIETFRYEKALSSLPFGGWCVPDLDGRPVPSVTSVIVFIAFRRLVRSRPLALEVA
jgi:hypothetical protein